MLLQIFNGEKAPNAVLQEYGAGAHVPICVVPPNATSVLSAYQSEEPLRVRVGNCLVVVKALRGPAKF